MKISILGDSISTYKDWNPHGYSVFYNDGMSLINGVKSVDQTWWYRTIAALNGRLCVNNSFSGSRVTGFSFPSTCSENRLAALRNNEVPDVILVYVGLNDFGFHAPLKRSIPFSMRRDPSVFGDAYLLMLRQMRRMYPKARIACGTLLQPHIWNDRTASHPGMDEIRQYNRMIRKSCRAARVDCADLERFASYPGYSITYETLDGTHPTAKGHATLASCWINALRAL